MRIHFISLFLVVLCITSCQSRNETQHFVEEIERAHGAEIFKSKELFSFDLKLSFRGKHRLQGRFHLSTDSRFGRIDLENGSSIVYRDGDVYTNDLSAKPSTIRFDAYTWSYFFMLPFKLNDPGTIWTDYKIRPNAGISFPSAKLSFESGTGDAPDDWYIIYSDENTKLINCAAYIVTANKTVEEAESDPHAIMYSDYEMIDGVMISKTWQFRSWNKEIGVTDTIGLGNLSNISFGDFDESLFNINGMTDMHDL